MQTCCKKILIFIWMKKIKEQIVLIVLTGKKSVKTAKNLRILMRETEKFFLVKELLC